MFTNPEEQTSTVAEISTDQSENIETQTPGENVEQTKNVEVSTEPEQQTENVENQTKIENNDSQVKDEESKDSLIVDEYEHIDPNHPLKLLCQIPNFNASGNMTIDNTENLSVWKIVKGKYHSDDGPAIEFKKNHAKYPDGKLFWFFEGKEITDPDHQVRKIVKDSKLDFFKWVTANGTRHRPQKGLFSDFNEKTGCGPASKSKFGEFWYVNGICHRDPECGPAFIAKCPVTNQVQRQEWKTNGILNNPFGPAVVTNNEKKWFIDGVQILLEVHQLTRTKLDEPIKNIRLGKIGGLDNVIEYWMDQLGQVSRPEIGCDDINGPAVTSTHAKYWFNGDVLNNYNGPAIIYEVGHPSHPNGKMLWFKNGQLINDDKEKIFREKEVKDGVITITIRNKDRIIHSPDENTPAIVEKSVDGTTISEKFYKDGLKHRDPLAGPAEIEFFENGKVKQIFYVEDDIHNPYGPAIIDNNGNEQWFIRGILINDEKNMVRMSKDINDDMKKMKITEMWQNKLQTYYHRSTENGPAIKGKDFDLYYESGELVQMTLHNKQVLMIDTENDNEKFNPLSVKKMYAELVKENQSLDRTIQESILENKEMCEEKKAAIDKKEELEKQVSGLYERIKNDDKLLKQKEEIINDLKAEIEVLKTKPLDPKDPNNVACFCHQHVITSKNSKMIYDMSQDTTKNCVQYHSEKKCARTFKNTTEIHEFMSNKF